MADIELKSLTFPNLNDIYMIPSSGGGLTPFLIVTLSDYSSNNYAVVVQWDGLGGIGSETITPHNVMSNYNLFKLPDFGTATVKHKTTGAALAVISIEENKLYSVSVNAAGTATASIEDDDMSWRDLING